ncbi:MAG TPA: segregation/condensation protein A [Saprospiraceae bacterium]|nr:segregation/condensation protein A [Saprospiraceae bacterium]
MNATATSYNIILPQFEGPFDLLLFFIERDELDIYNIPITKITDDFLDYIKQLEKLNIDMASEFILVAATLMKIKAKLLLPRKQIDDDGNEIDPREELVQRLLEYKQYKEVLEDIRILEERRHLQSKRGNLAAELQAIASTALVDVEWESITLFKLLKAFERILENAKETDKGVQHKVYSYPYTIGDQQQHILQIIKQYKKAAFTQVFSYCANRIHAIVTFLALLEMLNDNIVSIISGEGSNNFWISKN